MIIIGHPSRLHLWLHLPIQRHPIRHFLLLLHLTNLLNPHIIHSRILLFRINPFHILLIMKFPMHNNRHFRRFVGHHGKRDFDHGAVC